MKPTLQQIKENPKKYAINASDRWLATTSGTMPTGNYLWRVGDQIRKGGMIGESLWPKVENPTWEKYYIMPPIEIINKAKEFLKDWEVQYEVIDFSRESLLRHIKQAPLQVVIPGHAVMNFLTTDQIYKYFDSYGNPSFIKDRPEGFVFAQKYVLLPLTKKFMYNLVKDPLKTSEIYAVIGTTKRHIGNYYTLSQGNGVEWSYGTTNDIPFADVTAFAALTEGAEIVFTPHD